MREEHYGKILKQILKSSAKEGWSKRGAKQTV